MSACKTKTKADTRKYILQRIAVSREGCWIWTRHITNKGYGRTKSHGKMICTHRLSYEAFVNPIPDGLVIDHLCKVTQCVNPAHLEPVTATENVRRGKSATKFRGKKHCPHGHKYSDDNAYVWIDKKGGSHRCCKACKLAPKKEKTSAEV